MSAIESNMARHISCYPRQVAEVMPAMGGVERQGQQPPPRLRDPRGRMVLLQLAARDVGLRPGGAAVGLRTRGRDR